MLPGLATLLSRGLGGLENVTRASLDIVVSRKWVKYLSELPHLSVSGTTRPTPASRVKVMYFSSQSTPTPGSLCTSSPWKPVALCHPCARAWQSWHRQLGGAGALDPKDSLLTATGTALQRNLVQLIGRQREEICF